MPHFSKPQLPTPKTLNDPRSTGGSRPPLRDIAGLHGTLRQGRRS